MSLRVVSPRKGGNSAFVTKVYKDGAGAEKAYIRADGLARPGGVNMGYNFVAEKAAVTIWYTLDDASNIHNPEVAAQLTWISLTTLSAGSAYSTTVVANGLRFDFTAESAISVTVS